MYLSQNSFRNDLVDISNQLSNKFFIEGYYAQSIQQSQITLDLLGYQDANLLKNMAMCYFNILDVDKALECFRAYMSITNSKKLEDIRQLAQYEARCSNPNRLEDAYEIIKTKLPECNERHLDIGWFLHRDNHFKEAFIETEIGRADAIWTGNKHPPSCFRWEGDMSIKGAKLLVIGEAGMGDEIIFCRWIQKLEDLGATVYYWTNNSLQNVITRNFNVLKYDDTIKYDYWVPSMSLPYCLREEDPGNRIYLTPNPISVAKWKEKLKGYENIIALNWTGDQKHKENVFRTIPIDYLADNLQGKGTLVSVCLGSDQCPSNVIDLSRDIQTWDDTLAILSLSSCCYTSCSSVAHAAGALGVKTNLYDTVVGYFTWSDKLTGQKSKWYHDVTIWRQETMSDWHSVIDKSLS